MADPVALLMLSRPLEQFILYDQAVDLMRSPGVKVVNPPWVKYGVLGRVPDGVGEAMGRALARRLKPSGDPRVVIIFHPFQYPYAAGILNRWPEAELWYGLWDRYDQTYGVQSRTLQRDADLHARASERSSLTFAVSGTLAELEHAAGRDAIVMPSAADAFPAPDPGVAVIAFCFGHVGWRNDWPLLREVAERMPELTILMIGAVAENQLKDDPDYQRCKELGNFVWLGRRSDEDVARLMLACDVGLLPFTPTEFNQAGLPNRILKAARVGRKTIMTDLSGPMTWAEAVIRAPDADAWVAALREQAGARSRPDPELRQWALNQSAEHQNAPLWERLRALGVRPPP